MMFVSPNAAGRSSALASILQQMEVRPSEARSVAPPRMRLGTARSGETWADLARRATGNARDAEAVANINGFDLNTAVPAGMLVKLPEEVIPERRR
jgi:predicted Zn-dependent protease